MISFPTQVWYSAKPEQIDINWRSAGRAWKSNKMDQMDPNGPNYTKLQKESNKSKKQGLNGFQGNSFSLSGHAACQVIDASGTCVCHAKQNWANNRKWKRGNLWKLLTKSSLKLNCDPALPAYEHSVGDVAGGFWHLLTLYHEKETVLTCLDSPHGRLCPGPVKFGELLALAPQALQSKLGRNSQSLASICLKLQKMQIFSENSGCPKSPNRKEQLDDAGATRCNKVQQDEHRN